MSNANRLTKYIIKNLANMQLDEWDMIPFDVGAHAMDMLLSWNFLSIIPFSIVISGKVEWYLQWCVVSLMI